jgi:hypothetical protein
LFLLDKLVQGNRDALIALMNLDVSTGARFTRESSRDAYELLVRMQDHYREVLANGGITTNTDIAEHYDRVRLALLEGIIDTSPEGYRTSDARFLAGAIHWRAGRVDSAVRLWRAMRPALDDSYRLSSQRLLAELDARDERGRSSVDARTVSAALDAEDGRWLLFSFDRLRQFGYRFETY